MLISLLKFDRRHLFVYIFCRSAGRSMLHKKSKVEFHPLGVIGAIVSWNYPFHNIFNPMLAALFSGNSIVIKVLNVGVGAFLWIAFDLILFFGINWWSCLCAMSNISHCNSMLRMSFCGILYPYYLLLDLFSHGTSMSLWALFFLFVFFGFLSC